MRKVAFEISNNSIQASSSYAGPSVLIRYNRVRVARARVYLHHIAIIVPKLQ